MTHPQLVIVIFTLICVAASVWGFVAVIKSSEFKLKPLWILGSLIGFGGLSIIWDDPGSDVYVMFGFTIPVTMIFKTLPAGPTVVKTAFPIVAVMAILKARGENRKGR